MVEHQLPEPERMRRRAQRLASGLASAGKDRSDIERQLTDWHFHPAVAYAAAHSVPPLPSARVIGLLDNDRAGPERSPVGRC